MSQRAAKRRILIIDDSEAIPSDFRLLLWPQMIEGQEEFDLLAGALFGTASAHTKRSEPRSTWTRPIHGPARRAR